MKSIFKSNSPLPTWLSALGLVVAIIAIYLFIYIDSISSSHYSDYESKFDSPERVLQHVSCPSLMVQGEAKDIHAMIRHYFSGEAIDVSFAMDAPDFLSEKNTDTRTDLSENEAWTPHWTIVARKAGTFTITFSAIADKRQIIDSTTCKITVITAQKKAIYDIVNTFANYAVETGSKMG